MAYSISYRKVLMLNLKRSCVNQVIKRWKNQPDHWSRRDKNTSKDKALEHFDDFYQKVYDEQWPSIRVALLSESKYCAVVNNYSDTERIESELECQGAINVKKLIELRSKSSFYGQRRKTVEVAKKLDDKIESVSESKKEEELSLVYPENTAAPDMPSECDRLIRPSDNVSTSVLYEFIPATELKGMEDWTPESTHYSYYNSRSDFPVKIEPEVSLDFPESLKIYTFDKGNVNRFPKPGRGSTGTTDYYLMDGGSVLAVLALGLKQGDRVLDVCSAPGGKTLLCHQSLLPCKVHSNDQSESRVKRMARILSEFIYDYDKKESTKEIELTRMDARDLNGIGEYNKILVDVPCTTDRHSVTDKENNIFKVSRLKERIKLPELQTEILTNALKMVEVGGTVVYSTCTLSPIQNDGVVHMALKNMWEQTNHEIIVKDFTNCLRPYKVLFKFGDKVGLRYGHIVLPYLPLNFGPTYFCKLVKCK